jgi:Holliday junction resolvasome RuvABC ATP-dependent DNA helicase subunit
LQPSNFPHVFCCYSALPQVDYDEKEEVLNVVCTNMKVATKQLNMSDKIKVSQTSRNTGRLTRALLCRCTVVQSLFSMKNKVNKPKVVVDRIDGDATRAKNLVVLS